MIRFLVAEVSPHIVDAILCGINAENSTNSVDLVESAEAFLDKLSAFDAAYEVLIIGSGMGEIAGELTRDARQIVSNAHILYILRNYSLSAHRDALDMGATDVVSEERLPDSLSMRLQPIRHAVEIGNELRHQLTYAQHTAFSAMSSMGELGVVLDFLRKSFMCGEPVALANLIIDAVEQYGLRSIVRISIKDVTHVYSREGVDKPAEIKVMDNALMMGRIFEFRDRCAFNYGKVSIVVMGMPMEEPERVGRLRDNVALLAEAGEAKATVIELDLISRQRAQAIALVQKSILMNFKLMENNKETLKQTVMSRVFKLKEELEMEFLSMGLTADQEQILMDKVESHSIKLLVPEEHEARLSESLAMLAAMLEETDSAIS